MTRVSINGITATAASLQIPARGRWWLDVELDGDHALAGSVTTNFADLVLVGSVQSGGSFQGRSRFRIVAGAGGWGRELPAKFYTNDAGVKLSTILQDAANEVGEQIANLPGGTVGKSFTRLEAPASWALQELLASWYVDETGVTRTGARSEVTFNGEATRQELDAAAGRLTLAADSIATLLPGAQVDGLVAADVEHHYTSGAIRSILWGEREDDESRRLAAWRKLFTQLFPDMRYRGIYECRVVSQSGERLNLQPVRSSLGLPTLLRRVRVRPGVPGVRADHKLGSLVLVAFVDADPGRAAVVGFDDAESPGFVPSELDLVGVDDLLLVAAADPAKRPIRIGDRIAIAGTVVPGGSGAVDGVVSVSPTGVSYSRVRA